jgi:hypothetical protein
MAAYIPQYLLAVALAAHGLAHLPGFAVSWRLMASAKFPEKARLSDRLEGDGTGGRLMGILWLQTAIAYVALAACLAVRGSLPAAPAAAVLLISSILCLIEWPETRAGLFIDLALAGALSTLQL